MTTRLEFVPVDLIDPHASNPRRDLGDLTELVASIEAQGLRQNLLVVPQRDQRDQSRTGRYTAVIGHRRLAAAQIACLDEVPAVIDEQLDEAGQIELMLLENIQRTDLTPVEEAEGYQELLDLGVKVREIAKTTGRREKTVTARLRLLRLPDSAREKVHLRQATLEDAALLGTLDDRPDLQSRVAEALGTSNFDWRLREAQDTRVRDTKLQPLLDLLKTYGIRRMEGSRWDRGLHWVGTADTVEQLEEFLADIDDLSGWEYQPQGHQRTASISLYKAPASNATATAGTDPGADAAEQRDRERARAEEERQAIVAEGNQAADARDRWVRDFCGRKRILAKETLAITAATGRLLLFSGGIWIDPSQVAAWLTIDEDDWTGVEHIQTAFDAFCPSNDPALPLLVLLHLNTVGDAWQHAATNKNMVALYRLLEQLGYPVSDAERARVLPEPEQRCGACGHPDLDHDVDDGRCTITSDDPQVEWAECPCAGLELAS